METIIDAQNIRKHFEVGGGFLQTKKVVYAVDGVSIRLKKGQTLGLVGESGCGKSTLGRTLLRLLEPTEGTISIAGQDILRLSRSELRKARQDFQIVFQDPFSSLNPRMTIGRILAEPFKIHGRGKAGSLDNEIKDLLRLVGLPEDAMSRYPHEFSGGQRQRIGIARAIALKPKLIVADEPVSALDVSIQSQILNLLQDLKEQLNLSYVFIAHDLAVVEHISDVVAVMYLGKIVEQADVDDLFQKPSHPYTKALMAAIPVPEVKKRERVVLSGDVPSPMAPPPGCHFHKRCPIATERCSKEVPALRNIGTDAKPHLAACHYA